MTPPNWNHVDHEITREVLEGKRTDGDSMNEALSFAMQCCQADIINEDVTDKMFYERAKAYDLAFIAHYEGDLVRTTEALRRFWSI